MTEIVGSIGIEVVLVGREKLNRDLQELQTVGIAPIEVKLNTASLKKQLKGLELDCIPVKICPDIDGLKGKLKDLKLPAIAVDVQLKNTGNFQTQLRDLTIGRKLTIEIDTSKSEQSIQRLNQQLEQLQANIRTLNGQQVRINVPQQPVYRAIAPAATQAPISSTTGGYTLPQSPSAKLNVDSVEIRSAIAQSTSSIVSAVSAKSFVTQERGPVASTATSLYSGFVESIGGAVLPLMKDAIVGGFKTGLIDFEAVFKTGAGLFKQGIAAATGPARQVISGFQQGIGVSISSSFAGGFQKKLENEFGFTFEKIGEVSARRLISRVSTVAEKSGAVANRQEFKQVVGAGISFYEDTADDGTIIGGARRRYQEGYQASAERVKARAEEIAPTLKESDRDRFAFVSAGYAGQGGQGSQQLAESLKPFLNQSEVTAVANTNTDVRFDALKQPIPWLVNAITNTAKNGLVGSNKDAEEIAAQAYARYLRNPGSQIDLVGHSAGGFAASDAQQILKKLDVPSRAVSFGTPQFGILNPNPENNQASIGALDPLSPFSLASKNSKFYTDSTGAGHLAPSYLKSESFQQDTQNFLYQSPKLFSDKGITAKTDRDVATVRESLSDLARKQAALEKEIATANAEIDKAQQDYERKQQSFRKRARNSARVISDRRAFEADPAAFAQQQRQRNTIPEPVSDESRIGTRIPKAGLLEAGVEPTKQAFQAQVKANKERFRAEFDAAKSATGPEKAKRLQTLLKALDDEQDKIEQDLARKLGKNITGVLANYKGFIRSSGGLRPQVKDQLSAVESRFGKFEKPANPQTDAQKQELDQVVKAFNQGSDVGQKTGTNGFYAIGALPALAGLGSQGGGFALPSLAQLGAGAGAIASSPLGVAGLGAAGIAGGIAAARAARPILEPIAPVLYKDVGEIGRKAGALLLDGIQSRVQGTKDFFSSLKARFSELTKEAEFFNRGFGVGRSQAGVINTLNRFDTGKYNEQLDTRRIDPRLTNLGTTYAAGATVAANAGVSVGRDLQRDAQRTIVNPAGVAKDAIAGVISSIRNPIASLVDRIKQGERVTPRDTLAQVASGARDSFISGRDRVFGSVRQSVQEVRAGKSFNPLEIAGRAVGSAKSGFGASLSGALAGAKFEGKFGGIINDFKTLKALFSSGFNAEKPFAALADRVFPGLSAQLGSVVKGFLAFQALSFLKTLVFEFGGAALKASIRLDNLKTALNFAAGGPAQAAKELAFVRQETERLGIPLKTAQDGYAKLRASLKGAEGGALAQDIFSGVGSAATVLGLNGDQQGRIFTALQQISSKGVLSSEELKGQIGDAGLAGAFGVAARAIGVTEQELNKLLQTGSITSKDFLPKFAQQLNIEFGGAAANASKNVQSSIFRLESAFQKFQESSGTAFQPAVQIGANGLAGALNLVAERGDVLVKVIGTAALLLGSQFVTSLVGIPGLAKLAVTGLTTLAGAVTKVATTLFNPQFLVGFALITAGMETLRSTTEVFSLSEKGKQFKDFADQGEASLKRIEDAAKRARGEVSEVGPKPGKSTSKGFDLSFGFLGLTGLDQLGFSFKTDDLIKASNALNTKFNETVGLDKDFARFTTVEELQQQSESLEFDRFREKNQSLVGQAFDRSTNTDTLLQAKNLDQEIGSLQNRKNRLAASPNADKGELKALDEQIQTKQAERKKLIDPFVERQAAITSQINNTKNSLTNPALTGDQKSILEGDLQRLQNSQNELDRLQGKLGITTDKTRDLNKAFAEMASKLEEVKRQSDNAFNKGVTQDLTQQLAQFGSDTNASISAPVQSARRELDKASAEFEGNKQILDELAKKLQDPEIKDKLATAGIGSTGRTASLDSSIADLELAKGTANSDAKPIIDNLINYKKAQDQQTALEKDGASARIAVRKAEEQAKLAEIEKANRERESQIKRDSNTAQIGLLEKQKTGSIYEADASAESANLQVTKGRAELDSTKQQLDGIEAAFAAGTLSAEEYEKQRREIGDRISDQEVQNAQNEVAAVKAAEAAKLAEIERSARKREAQIKQQESAATVGLIRQKIGKSISEEDAGIAQAQIGLNTANAQKSSAQSQLDELESAFARGIVKKEEYERRSQDFSNNLADLSVRQAEQELALREATNRKIIEQFERTSKLVNANIDAQLSDRSINFKLGGLDSSGFVGIKTQIASATAERDAAQQRFDQLQKEDAEVTRLNTAQVVNRPIDSREQQKFNFFKDLGFDIEAPKATQETVKVLSDKEAEDRKRQIDQNSRAQRDRIVELDAQIQLKGIQANAEAETRVLNNRKTALESELKLTQAIADARQSTLKIGIDRTNENIDGVKALQSKDTGANLRAVLQQQLGGSGVSGAQPTDVLTLTQNRQALEREADAEKLAAMQAQQQLERESLAIQLQLEKVSARKALNEAKVAENAAKQNVLDAQKELRLAKKSGNAEEISSAQDYLNFAQESQGFARENININQEQNALIDERIAKEKQAQSVQQQTARDALQAENAKNGRARDREQAQLKDQLLAQGFGGGGVGGAGSSGGGGLGASGGLVLSGGDITAYDNARRAFSQAIAGNEFRGQEGQKEAVLNALSLSSGREKEFLSLIASKSGFGEVADLTSKLDSFKSGPNAIGVASAVNKAATSGGDVIGALKQMTDRIEKLANTPRSLSFTTQDPVSDYAKFMNESAGSSLRNL
ncbi:MAG: tape measure protein [Myxacorys californica WJT36-NPBG1]|jgi:tape measure domain-containing protein|nr:tape measure protein [Myxacorys californica WJT36-NPBG1]